MAATAVAEAAPSTSGKALPAPAATASKAAEAAAAAVSHHVIARGDTLWDIAVKYYGSGILWKKLADANGGPNPRRLVVGQELEVPQN